MYQLEFDTSINLVCPFFKGQTLYYVSLDGVTPITLERSFEIGDIKRYSSKYDTYIGGHKTFSDDDINKTIFTSKSEAFKYWTTLTSQYDFISPMDMKISMSHSFISYTTGQSHGNGNPLLVEAHIAIINDEMIYVQRFADFAFLHKFVSREEMEREYIYKLTEMRNYSFKSNILKEIYFVKPTLKNMYQLNQILFAEGDYIEKKRDEVFIL